MKRRPGAVKGRISSAELKLTLEITGKEVAPDRWVFTHLKVTPPLPLAQLSNLLHMVTSDVELRRVQEINGDRDTRPSKLVLPDRY